MRSIENYLHMSLGKLYNISFLGFSYEKPFRNLKADWRINANYLSCSCTWPVKLAFCPMKFWINWTMDQYTKKLVSSPDYGQESIQSPARITFVSKWLTWKDPKSTLQSGHLTIVSPVERWCSAQTFIHFTWTLLPHPYLQTVNIQRHRFWIKIYWFTFERLQLPSKLVETLCPK